MHAQAALDELEAARADAALEQLAAERGQRVAEAAQRAAEAARDAAEVAQVVAEDATQEAELAQRHLQDFLAMAAHDLRSPLAAIAGYTDLLAVQTTQPDQHTLALDAIQTAVLQMNRLVEDIVDAGRLGAGAFSPRPRRVDLVALVQQVVRDQQQTSERHRILVDAPEQAEGTWDPDRLAQVMTNLLSNAIKYSPSGGDILICIRAEHDTVMVSVADQGRGLPAADVPLLFRPFARLLPPPGEQEQVTGTGLGLYISYGIIKAHHGSIWATSEGEGCGSTFNLRLPWSSTNLAADSSELHEQAVATDSDVA